MIENLVKEFGAWSWWIVGFVFLILEIIAPGTFFLWIGLAALIVGGVALLFPIAWQAQIVAFAVLGLVLAIIGRKLYAHYGIKSEREHLNERGREYIGRTYTLTDDMKNGEGRLKIGDTFWLIRGAEDLTSGSEVTVTGADGTVLLIRSAL